LSILKWYVDASFAVHADFEIHFGSVMSIGKGAIITISQKQKLNTKSSITVELFGADDVSTMMLGTKFFMVEQGYPIKENILHRDKRSGILLE